MTKILFTLCYKVLLMSNSEHIKAIHEIRKMMHKSARFLSLSGLSGLFAGSYALIAAFIAFQKLGVNNDYKSFGESLNFYLGLAAITLIMAFLTAFYFTRRKAIKDGVTVWNETVKHATINLFIPLVTGGIFILALLNLELYGLLAPACLIFYGLALVNVSRYTFDEIRQLGLLEIALGLANCFFIGYGLLFWAIGFGILHISYGIYMYYKYEK